MLSLRLAIEIVASQQQKYNQWMKLSGHRIKSRPEKKELGNLHFKINPALLKQEKIISSTDTGTACWKIAQFLLFQSSHANNSHNVNQNKWGKKLGTKEFQNKKWSSTSGRFMGGAASAVAPPYRRLHP